VPFLFFEPVFLPWVFCPPHTSATDRKFFLLFLWHLWSTGQSQVVPIATACLQLDFPVPLILGSRTPNIGTAFQPVLSEHFPSSWEISRCISGLGPPVLTSREVYLLSTFPSENYLNTLPSHLLPRLVHVTVSAESKGGPEKKAWLSYTWLSYPSSNVYKTIK
jgi:hypothetical protein